MHTARKADFSVNIFSRAVCVSAAIDDAVVGPCGLGNGIAVSSAVPVSTCRGRFNCVCKSALTWCAGGDALATADVDAVAAGVDVFTGAAGS